ncbi:hypothetical protein GA0061078_0131 [Bifidobacterium bohemicum]|uniref:Lipoprotein n=1 Tax=Bifidobacterium bohemicum DSM 22767 TaxID=1437606 RepID=A0A086ZG68_9BIFI|nr:DUF4176 domain-containing protein [Bifidobacterium bohemicum]KFI45518.1 lipoprotein [Bifidobacterium bohemicum DSM 22767]SCB71670.1 hypothetical protein GA0061078_0131 [Bifidobacterium bohemicum]
MAVVNYDGWLPIGSLVHLKGGERLTMVTGQMQEEAGTGTYWDYLGYPYPEGRADASKDYFFNKDFIDGVYFLGYQDVAGGQYLDLLKEHEDEFHEEQAKRAGRGGDLHKDTDEADEDDQSKSAEA